MTNWGLISTARINDALLRGIRSVDGATALAVCSRDAGRAERYAQAHGIERSYGGYELLLEDPDVEIVYVSLPNGMHVEWTRRALEAGKHVLCEKPLSSAPAQVGELFDLAESRGLALSEAFMYRHHPQTAQIKALVDSGELGVLRLIRGSFSFSCDADDPRLVAGLDGGALMDVGCYPVNLARLLAGEPERVTAEQLIGGDGVDVVMAGVLRFADGVIAEFNCGLAMPRRSEVEIVGSTAVLRVANPWKPTTHGLELWRDGVSEPELIHVPEADPYAIEVADLCAAVRGERAPLLGRADAVGQSRTLAALYEAAASGAAVRL